jgi:hypothetical protein
VQCSAVQCSAVPCSAVQCSAVQCSAVQCSAVQCSAVQCSAGRLLGRGPSNGPRHLLHSARATDAVLHRRAKGGFRTKRRLDKLLVQQNLFDPGSLCNTGRPHLIHLDQLHRRVGSFAIRNSESRLPIRLSEYGLTGPAPCYSSVIGEGGHSSEKSSKVDSRIHSTSVLPLCSPGRSPEGPR